MSSERNSFYIDGGWVPPATRDRIQLVNASTEEPIGSVPEGRPADIDRAIAAARRAFERSEWSRYTPAERGAALGRFADALDRRGAELARAVSLQNGMPIGVAQQMEHGYAVAILRYYAALAAGLQEEEQRPSPLGMTTVGSYAKLCIATPMRRAQLCVVRDPINMPHGDRWARHQDRYSA